VSAVLLDDVARFVRRFVVLSEHEANAIALWIAHTHALDAFEQSPYLAISSPEKQCGKSRLLDVLELVVARPWRVISPSEAVLFRKVDVKDGRPTLLLDETDALFSKDANTEGLRALLNAGNRRGTKVPRCVGPKLELRDFEIFCAKALAGIRELPDTISDRAIAIRLKRRMPSEPIDRFIRRDVEPEGHTLGERLSDWLEPQLEWLRSARPELPPNIADRAADAWEPLLAIASLAGEERAELVRSIAVSLAGARDDDSDSVRLLVDIEAILIHEGLDRISSAALEAALAEIEDAPWPEWRAGKPITKSAIARLLRHFEIRPRTIRLDDGTTAKGYMLEWFEEAFSRYIPVSKRHTVTTRMDSGIPPHFETSHVTDGDAGKPAWLSQCDGVTAENAKGATQVVFDADEVERLAELAREATSEDGKRRAPLPGGRGFLDFIAAVHRAGHITTGEALEREQTHRLVLRARAA
jgi:hypothetical protein